MGSVGKEAWKVKNHEGVLKGDIGSI